MTAGDRWAARQRESRPIIADLVKWMRAERARLSRHAETAKAIDYILTRCPAFTRFLHDAGGLGDCCRFIAGDAFEILPRDGDAYVLSNFLVAVILLRNCLEA